MNADATLSRPDTPSAAGLARRMREVLQSGGFRTEGHRKGALRRLLHEAVVGLDEENLARFLDDLKSRFPDRAFEATSRVRLLEQRLQHLEKELAALRAREKALEKKAGAGDLALTPLYETVYARASGSEKAALVGGSVTGPAGDEAMERFAAALRMILEFTFDQEATLYSVEETLGAKARKGEGSLAELLSQILKEGGRPAELSMEVERRLRRLRLLPGALMSGAQQSWKGGTRGLLEYLDPKAAEEEVPARLPGLREAAVLKEVRKRYEQFWDELDKNIAHYYRGTFEKIYTEKMEGRS